jgi:tetratricopeptide (TPR) repeat protein
VPTISTRLTREPRPPARASAHPPPRAGPQAIKCYKHFLESCLESGDSVGEALACNSIGVDYQIMGESHARQAVQYHTKHLEVADVPGKYIAHVNLGLCYATLGMAEEAVANHQHALRYAIRMCSLAGESLACGNLGMIASLDDLPTAKACAERQLQLARTLNDSRGKGDAYRQLGVLSNLMGEHTDAVHYFQQTMQLAQAEGDELVSNSARCAIGVARGNAGFDGLLRSFIDRQAAAMSGAGAEEHP